LFARGHKLDFGQRSQQHFLGHFRIFRCPFADGHAVID
jgi:hypothetical protein